MKLDYMLIYTDIIPIYNAEGTQMSEIRLPEKVTPASRRRCGWSENRNFYKGAGIIYQGHYANEVRDNMIMVSRNTIEYQKYNVVYPHLFQKFGIFTFCHQPIFSDCEGAFLAQSILGSFPFFLAFVFPSL